MQSCLLAEFMLNFLAQVSKCSTFAHHWFIIHVKPSRRVKRALFLAHTASAFLSLVLLQRIIDIYNLQLNYITLTLYTT